MSEDRQTWIRHSVYLAVFTAVFHSLQFVASLVLWAKTDSPVLMSFGLDAFVSAVAAVVLAARIQREWRNRLVAYGYMAASVVAFYLGGSMLWGGRRPGSSVLGIVVAAVLTAYVVRATRPREPRSRVVS